MASAADQERQAIPSVGVVSSSISANTLEARNSEIIDGKTFCVSHWRVVGWVNCGTKQGSILLEVEAATDAMCEKTD